MPTGRPFGRGPYGTLTYSTYGPYRVLDVGGVAVVVLNTEGELSLIWTLVLASGSCSDWVEVN